MQSSAEAFVAHELLHRTPWIFQSDREYVTWRVELAEDLQVDPFAIVIVGSACTGYSLNPAKEFRKFNQASDIDVAIVSHRHFEDSWRWLRDLKPADLLTGSLEADMFKWHRRNLVFDGTIATDRLLSRLPFGPIWASGLNKASSRLPSQGHAVKGRIYRDFESLRSYHVKNIAGLRRDLQATTTVPTGTKLRLVDAEDAAK